jgi:ATP-dependent protease ClpP protease subunit
MSQGVGLPIEITGKKPICISFLSAISPQTTPAFVGALANAVNNGHDEIHLLLSTPGGTTQDGIAIYNTLRALPVPVRTYNVGNVNSIGNVIYQAGCRRICAENSSFMFHGVGFDIQNARLELKQLNEQVRSIQNDQSLIASIITRHTGLAEQEVDRLFLAMEYMNAKTALERGIADEIGDIRLPKGVPIHQLIFQ